MLEGVLSPLVRSKKPRDLAGWRRAPDPTCTFALAFTLTPPYRWPLLLQLPTSVLPFLQRAVRLLARQKRLPAGIAPKLQARLQSPKFALVPQSVRACR